MFNDFWRDDRGASTIDWVALTAGMLMLGIALVYGIFNDGVDPVSQDISETLIAIDEDIDIGDAPELNSGS